MSNLPTIEDAIVMAPDFPNIQDKVRERWAHKKLNTATMTINLTETNQGRPQLEVILNCNGASQLFWVRRAESASNWMLSRVILPFINTIRALKKQDLYDYGTEMQAETLEAYISNDYVQGMFKQGIQVRAITSTRPSIDANGKRVVRSNLDFVHLNDEGSKAIFDMYESSSKADQDKAIEVAQNLNQKASTGQQNTVLQSLGL